MNFHRVQQLILKVCFAVFGPRQLGEKRCNQITNTFLIQNHSIPALKKESMEPSQSTKTDESSTLNPQSPLTVSRAKQTAKILT